MRTEAASNTSKVSSSEHNRLYSVALSRLERIRVSPLFSEIKYVHIAKGITLSISLIKKQDYVAVIIIGDHVPSLFSKGKVLNNVPLIEGAEQLAEQVRYERLFASKQLPRVLPKTDKVL
jgi:hypothetical protein